MMDTIHSTFERIVDEFPDHVAIKTETQSISYSYTNQLANQLAEHIRKCSKKLLAYSNNESSGILVYLSPSAERIISVLGVLKAGYAYIPLEGVAPLQRLKYIMSDTGCHFVVTEQKYLNYFLKLGVNRKNIFCWEDD